MFSPIGNTKSLSQQIEEKLTNAIHDGEYKVGEKIPTEKELCEIFQVSRTAVREAIKTMAAKGIIDVKKGSGAYVSEVSIKNASEILNMFFELSTDKDLILQTIKARQFVEPLLASEAAKNRTDAHIEILTKNINDIRSCSLNDSKKEAELDNDFHQILLSITDNSVLKLLLGPIFNLMPKFKKSVFAKPTKGNLKEEKAIMLNHHESIFNAIVNQNEEKAAQAMRDHLDTTYSNYMNSRENK